MTMVDPPTPLAVVCMSDLGPTLKFRDSVDALFDRLEANPTGPVAIDFTGVEFISRSAAHEYLVRKARSRHSISVSGIGVEVARMLDLVKCQMDRSKRGVARPTSVWSTAPPQTI